VLLLVFRSFITILYITHLGVYRGTQLLACGWIIQLYANNWVPQYTPSYPVYGGWESFLET
jgi:hypothetical protein